MTLRLGVLIAVVLASFNLVGCASDALTSERHTFTLGTSEVHLIVHHSPADGHRYVVLHDDENTAVEAGLEIVRSRGGRLIELRHDGKRNVEFILDGMRYRFDPNRIFTPTGVARTLERWSEAEVDTTATAAVQAFADTLLSILAAAADGHIVAIHNNTEDGYSVLSYQSGGDLAAEAQLVHVASDEDPDDFVLTTTQDFFNRARNAGLHAVLQRTPPATDDGSLSVHAALAGIPYMNVEAEHGHYEQQLKMLELMKE